MPTEENKALVRRFYADVFERRDLSALEQYLAADYVDHTPPPGVPAGIEGTRQWFGRLLAAFPDARVTVEDQIAEGDKVVARVGATGTQNGEFMGMPASGRQVGIEGIDILRFTGGKIVEHWGQFDILGMLQQLGAIPPPGQAPR